MGDNPRDRLAAETNEQRQARLLQMGDNPRERLAAETDVQRQRKAYAYR